MDLNELLHAHQIEVMKASACGDGNHFNMIAEYADRIQKLRTVTQSTPIPQDPSAPPTIIYGSYAGNTAEEGANYLPTGSDSSAREQSENPDRGRANA